MGSRPDMPAVSADRGAALDALHAEIARRNMFPFWAATPGAQHDEVRRLMGETRRAAPFLWSSGGGTLLWEGPTIPVVGTIDLSTDEIQQAALNGFRLAAVGLAFAAYALLLDHDRLVGSVRFARGSALAVALAARLVPTLERDAMGLRETVRGRGIELSGARAYAKLLSPLVAGSLERASCLAEAMEARGFGRPGATRPSRR